MINCLKELTGNIREPVAVLKKVEISHKDESTCIGMFLKQRMGYSALNQQEPGSCWRQQTGLWDKTRNKR